VRGLPQLRSIAHAETKIDILIRLPILPIFFTKYKYIIGLLGDTENVDIEAPSTWIILEYEIAEENIKSYSTLLSKYEIISRVCL
jgi:hypothetical protein